MSQALEFYRSPARYLAARGIAAAGAGGRLAGAVAGSVSPLRLVDRPAERRDEPGWVRLRPLLSGICGSDLALLGGHSSPYLTALASLPFVPGHEIVAETVAAAPGLPAGSRVVVDPVLSCAARGTRPCPECRAGRRNRCGHITTGSLRAGLQTGFCADTGGGWSRSVVAHVSQLHRVPDELADRTAVLVEPLACAVHSVRRAAIAPGASVLVVGAGTVGLLTVLALREFTAAGPIYAVAKHPHQRALAEALGATETFGVRRLARALRMLTGGTLEHPDLGADFLLGGVDVAFDCTGGAGGLDTALRTVRAGGTVVMSGMPSGAVDLAPVWFRELHLIGSYASAGGPEAEAPAQAPDFAEAVRLAGRVAPLAGFVDAVYPLSRWREAIGHALSAGRLGSVKVAFDPNRS
ncbi:zinc-dependent alcohol dehydrogenase [Actinacidiphila paucisporea]|uniref:2-deoxy-scyllo-inosamine dehydrogenase n=1 Tax=Actinacidiphila paucisporea TaxID=310782 RepID=A0A1M7PNI1_9ACTN|nr:zinc-binding dehydrogenase [Actinacidiphila paucisporea]SHN18656.1 Threonine dehydrogenase [Actinacidiphila paucisporea]